jgi:tRNA dimethylallyltransferase
MQIYKEMSVSTAKPTIEEMDGVKHHLIDFVDITDTYSVSDYCRDAKAVFDDIISRGKLPVIVGGTGLYIDSFITNTQFFDDAQSDEIRKRLQKQANDEGLDVLYNRLKEIDPDAAAKIHPNNSVRVIRALEVYEATGKTITQQSEQSHSVASDIDALYIGINYSDREKLYDRINRRVDIMMENGLLDEAKSLFSGEYSATAVNSIGCKEMKPFLDGEKSLSECVEKLKMSTRHYAKRQLTWFRRNESVKWVYPDKQNEDELYSQIVEYINDFLKE